MKDLIGAAMPLAMEKWLLMDLKRRDVTGGAQHAGWRGCQNTKGAAALLWAGAGCFPGASPPQTQQLH
jgi:hypothetical protein